MNGKVIWLILFLAGVGYWTTRPFSPNLSSVTTTDSADPQSSDVLEPDTGYNWAEEHNIDDVDNCDKAEETSNSPSFAEGCRAYVEENGGTTG